jgi:hypothetical protein
MRRAPAARLTVAGGAVGPGPVGERRLDWKGG